MSRFKVYPAHREWLVLDTRIGREVIAIKSDTYEAGRVAAVLNGVKPLWYASTYRGVVFFDARMGPYAGALSMTVKEIESMGVEDAFGVMIRKLEVEMYSALALHAAGFSS